MCVWVLGFTKAVFILVTEGMHVCMGFRLQQSCVYTRQVCPELKH